MEMKCTNNLDLFSSPYLEEFSEAAFLEDNPHASAENIEAARIAHNQFHELAVAAARTECFSCPVLETCRKMTMDIKEPVYGIMAGMDAGERRAYRESGGKIIGIGAAAEALLGLC